MIRNRSWLIVVLLAGLVGGFYWYDQQKIKTATLSFGQPSQISLRQEVVVPVLLDSASGTINAAEVYAHFDPTHLQVKSLSKEPSIFTIWIKDQPQFSNQNGEVSFAGGLPTPGFKGSGPIGTIVLIPIASGQTEITFDHKSRILLNDGLGSIASLRLSPITLKVR